MWIGFSQGETDIEAIAAKGLVYEKQGEWKKFSHPQRPFPISPIKWAERKNKMDRDSA